MRIGITYDLRELYLSAGYSELQTAEFDRPDTIEAITNALRALGHDPEPIGNVMELIERLAAGERWELVFNIAEGLHGFGREAQVPAVLEAYGIPYTFSDPLALALTLHKGMAKHLVQAHGVRTAAFQLVGAEEDIAQVSLPFPLFAKPVAEGTGKGVTPASKAQSRASLRAVCRELLEAYCQPVLVEHYLPGREFTVAILGTERDAKALGSIEIILRQDAEADMYSYHNKKYYETLVDYRLVDDPVLGSELEALALAAWRCLGCRDAGRVDLRLDEQGLPHFLEVNPLAGLHPQYSDLPIIATMKGVPYQELIARILDSALARCAREIRTVAWARPHE